MPNKREYCANCFKEVHPNQRHCSETHFDRCTQHWYCSTACDHEDRRNRFNDGTETCAQCQRDFAAKHISKYELCPTCSKDWTDDPSFALTMMG